MSDERMAVDVFTWIVGHETEIEASEQTMYMWKGYVPRVVEGMLQGVAEDAARKFYDDDGWEASWPITVAVKLRGQDQIHMFEVEMQAEPHFYVSKKEVAEHGN